MVDSSDVLVPCSQYSYLVSGLGPELLPSLASNVKTQNCVCQNTLAKAASPAAKNLTRVSAVVGKCYTSTSEPTRRANIFKYSYFCAENGQE